MIPVPASVREALAALYGASVAQLDHFAGGHNENDGIIYAYPHGDGRRLLKVMAIPAADQQRGLFCLEERLRFMRFLGEHDAPIVFPLLSPQGRLYERHSAEEHLWVGYTMDIAPGQGVPGDRWDPAFFRAWGRAIGMLHRLTQLYPSWEASVDPLTGAEMLTWWEEWQGFHGWCRDEQVKAAWLEMGQRLDQLPRTRDSFGFVHNDPHINNLLADGERVTVLDFDVSNHHWFTSDIAIACQSVLFSMTGGMERPLQDRARLRAFLDFFLEGYARENHLSAEWLDRLNLFIAYRRLLMFTVMQDWLEAKPDVRHGWKQMILTEPEVVGLFAV
jgi:Ser/Thr protein kinase RdoA (MazF antagonist)